MLKQSDFTDSGIFIGVLGEINSGYPWLSPRWGRFAIQNGCDLQGYEMQVLHGAKTCPAVLSNWEFCENLCRCAN